MKLAVVSTPHFFVEEHQILTALFDEGLELLHLRKPESEPVFCERLLTLIPIAYRKRIVVHDHFYLQHEYSLRGIHLNMRNPEPPRAYRGTLSCTCHTPEEVRQRKKQMDYVFLSGVFGTDSAAFSAAQLREMSKAGTLGSKVYAQGNISLDNIGTLKDYGFGGAVVFSDLWNRFNIYSTQDFSDIIAHFRRLQKAIG